MNAAILRVSCYTTTSSLVLMKLTITTVESLIWRTVLDVIGEKTIGIDLNHLTSSTSPLYDLFSQTMQQSVLSHIFHYLSSYLPLRHLIPCKSNSNFVRCCDEVREHIMHWVMVRYEAFYRGEPLVGLPDVISVMIEQGGMFSVTNIVEYVSVYKPAAGQSELQLTLPLGIELSCSWSRHHGVFSCLGCPRISKKP